MEPPPDDPRRRWPRRWSRLARACGLTPDEPLVLALSGGADSVLLLHLLHAAPERPLLAAVHVDHGLRGAQSDEDARFCARLCAGLGVRFALRRARLDPAAGDLEARARQARLDALAEEARRLGCRTVATAHHADDRLETVLMRWIRGSGAPSDGALRRRLELRRGAGPPVAVVRPLLAMRRHEVRAELARAGVAWREDASNRDARFTRNRVRNVLLPRIEALAGPRSLENLRAFGAAVESLERHLATATAHLAWEQPEHAVATRSARQAGLGGSLPRAALMQLPAALRRRALERLLLEGTGRGVPRALLEALLEDLQAGRCSRHALPRGFALVLRARALHLVPPPALLDAGERARRRHEQMRIAFPGLRDWPGERARDAGALALPVPGAVALPDGRRIEARYARCDAAAPVPRGPTDVQLALDQPVDALEVRFPRPGDRFHPLGAPGSRPLARFLADAGVPREERARVALVLAGSEVVWAAGLRPSERARVRPPCALRLCLTLHGAAEPPALVEPPAPAAAPAPTRMRQGALYGA